MNQKEFFLECARVLETEGWIQERMSEVDAVESLPNETCARCSLGVIECVYARCQNVSVRGGDLVTTFASAIGGTRYIKADSVIDWNDAKGRTKEEVIAMFRQVAEQFGDA